MNSYFKRLKTLLPLFFIGGGLIVGIVDGLRVLFQSDYLFFGFADKILFIFFAIGFYAILIGMISFFVSLIPVERLRRNLDTEQLPALSLAYFISVTIGLFIFIAKLRIGALINNPLKGIIALILIVVAILAFTWLLSVLFGWLKLSQIFLKIARKFPKRLCYIAIFALFILSIAVYKLSGSLNKLNLSFDKPNIILISLDTLGAKHVGSYGYEKDITPNLDKFAEQGVKFEKAYSVSYWTLPSHISILTSLYPSVHRVVDIDRVLDEKCVTLAEVLQENGYFTGAFVDGDPNSNIGANHGFDQGFEFYAHYDEHFNKFERLFLVDQALNFYKRYRHKSTHCNMHSEYITKNVVNWLNRYNKNKPLFLFLHYFDIHSDTEMLPYEAPFPYMSEEAWNQIMNSSFKQQYLHDLSWNLRDGTKKREDFDPTDVNALVETYDAGIKYTDHFIGELLKKLDELGLRDNSIVIITADHGEEFLEHDQFQHYQYYNEVIHVPLIMRFPKKFPQNYVVSNPVSSIDILPTILDLVDIAPDKQFQGKSLLPYVFDSKNVEAEQCFGGEDLMGSNSKYIISNDTKLIYNDSKRAKWVFNQGKRYELYDLLNDPNELKDILEGQEMTKEAENLKKDLQTWSDDCRKTYRKLLGSSKKNVMKIDKKTKEKLKALGYVK